MHLKTILNFSILLFLLNILFSTVGFSYTKDQKKLVPLEKEILIDWVNDNCHEKHNTWQELIADGRIKCNKNDKPESFSSLRFVKHYTSSRSSDFRINSAESYFMYFIQLSAIPDIAPRPLKMEGQGEQFRKLL